MWQSWQAWCLQRAAGEDLNSLKASSSRKPLEPNTSWQLPQKPAVLIWKNGTASRWISWPRIDGGPRRRSWSAHIYQDSPTPRKNGVARGP